MKIVLASRNRHKIGELQALLAKHIPNIEILSLDDVGFEGDIVEDGDTFEQNAYIKARAAASKGYIGVGDDSGLCVNALGGAPGIYSARYAGEHGDDKSNNALLLKNLQGVSDRSAQFVCVIACVFPDDLDNGTVFRGVTEGVIIEEYRGEGGFGYDPLFECEGTGKTYSEMSPEEKNEISHRSRAIALFAAAMKETYEKGAEKC
jgi:XTP/dITP diphosphohydrolase